MAKHYGNKWFWILVVAVIINVAWYGEKLYFRHADIKPVMLHGVTFTDKDHVPLKDLNVCRGTFLYYTVDLEKKMNVSCTVYKELINDYRISYDPKPATSTAIGRWPVNNRIYIPVTTDTDEWMMRLTVECKIEGRDEPVREMVEAAKINVIDCGLKRPKREE